MTAKEMFEELGYKPVSKTDTSVRYESQPTIVGAYEFYIEIWKREEFGDDFLIRKATMGRQFVSNICGEELKAINQQCKELGWLDE
jgi:hypothetical protein